MNGIEVCGSPRVSATSLLSAKWCVDAWNQCRSSSASGHDAALAGETLVPGPEMEKTRTSLRTFMCQSLAEVAMVDSTFEMDGGYLLADSSQSA
jgi:hypothetical protein